MSKAYQGSGYYMAWDGDEVVEQIGRKARVALQKVGDMVVGEARAQLYVGHGYRTGALYKSLSRRVFLEQARLILEIGSPLPYALYVEKGRGNFPGYHMLCIAFGRVMDKLAEVLREVFK